MEDEQLVTVLDDIHAFKVCLCGTVLAAMMLAVVPAHAQTAAPEEDPGG